MIWQNKFVHELGLDLTFIPIIEELSNLLRLVTLPLQYVYIKINLSYDKLNEADSPRTIEYVKFNNILIYIYI